MHPSYIKDKYDITKIRKLIIPKDAYLFTMDVNNLYTNIDITEGIKIIEEIFIHLNPKRPEKELIELLNINLRRNNFEFNNNHYLQLKGTAMGKKFAPAYANIFMAQWEKKALRSSRKNTLQYFMFLDDIWGIWSHPREDFQAFVDLLNKQNTSIMVKAEINSQKVHFLGITIYKGLEFNNTGILETKIYFKPMLTQT